MQEQAPAAEQPEDVFDAHVASGPERRHVQVGRATNVHTNSFHFESKFCLLNLNGGAEKKET